MSKHKKNNVLYHTSKILIPGLHDPQQLERHTLGKLKIKITTDQPKRNLGKYYERKYI